MVGARTVISPNAAVLDPEALRRIIEKQNVTAMLATPSTWRMLLNSGWQGSRQFKALCWGEALQPELAERLAEVCAEVWNIYGAVETTFVSMIGRVHAGAPVILGQPIDNTHVVLADEQFEPVPVGVPGEILISGTGLARGYRNLPALTAEKFLYRSIGGQSPDRFFRTGDMARYRPDGYIGVYRPNGSAEKDAGVFSSSLRMWNRSSLDILLFGMRWYPFGRISTAPRGSLLTSFWEPCRKKRCLSERRN